MTDTDTERRPDRHSRVTAAPLRPDSLVGSYFHSDAGRRWQGVVVAEPQPGIYLVEIFEWLAGTSWDQQLVPISEMADWRFYDDSKWMVNAYENGIERRWERERCETEANAGSPSSDDTAGEEVLAP